MTTTRHYYPDLTRPLDKARGARTRTGYYTLRDGPLIAARPGAKERGVYLDRYGAETANVVRLRVMAADDVPQAGITHRGHYADEYGDTRICGLVARLPRSRGFLVGWTMGAGMASVIDSSMSWDDEREAARAADDFAARAAEAEREYQAREAARAELDDMHAIIQSSRRMHSVLARELGAAHIEAYSAVLRAELRERLRHYRREVADAYARIRELRREWQDLDAAR